MTRRTISILRSEGLFGDDQGGVIDHRSLKIDTGMVDAAGHLRHHGHISRIEFRLEVRQDRDALRPMLRFNLLNAAQAFCAA